MEKYSQFRDPLTGIHPFINPKQRLVRPNNLLRLALRLVLLPLLFVFPRLLCYFVRIQAHKRRLRVGTYAVNRGSFLDACVLRYLYRGCSIYYLSPTGFSTGRGGCAVPRRACLNFVFVEECVSNNTCVVRFVRSLCVDGVLGLRYSSSCIYMYGSKWRFALRFLGSHNFCEVNVKEGGACEDLTEVTGLVKVDRGIKEYNEFYSLLNKK